MVCDEIWSTRTHMSSAKLGARSSTCAAATNEHRTRWKHICTDVHTHAHAPGTGFEWNAFSHCLVSVCACVRVCVYNYIRLVRMCERVCVYYYRQLVRIFVNAMCGDASYPHWVQLANLTTHFGSELQTQHNNACGCVSLERRHLPKTHHHHPTQEGASDVSASTCIIYFSASSH